MKLQITKVAGRGTHGFEKVFINTLGNANHFFSVLQDQNYNGWKSATTSEIKNKPLL